MGVGRRYTHAHTHNTLSNTHSFTDFFYGLPGFQTHDLYDDFSTPCFDSEHNMMCKDPFPFLVDI